MMAAVLMVREERKRIKPEEVEDACEVSLMKNHQRGGEVLRRVTEVVFKAVNGMVGEELGMTAAGAGGDR